MKQWYRDRRAELLNGELTSSNWPMWVLLGAFIAVCNLLSVAFVAGLLVLIVGGSVLAGLALLTPDTAHDIINTIQQFLRG